jgi:hypothetical protein
MTEQKLEDPIDSIVAQLQSIVASALEHGDRIGYFAALYERVTRTVRSKIGTGYFDDDQRMERLDAVFANRYLTAVEQYRRGDASLAPVWKLAFDATCRSDLIVVQHLLLGVGAHIGVDLPMAAAAICPGSQIAGLEADFDKINAVLAAVVPTVITELSAVSPCMHLLADLVEGDEVSIIDFGLTDVRNSVWGAAQKLAVMNPAEQAAWLVSQTATVLRVGHDVLSPGLIAGSVLDVVRAAEVTDVKRIIDALNAGEPLSGESIALASTGRVSAITGTTTAAAAGRPEGAHASVRGASPNHVYYFDVAPGRWLGTLTFEITSWRRLWTSPISLKSKLIASAMGAFAGIFGPASIESQLTPHPDRGAAGEAINRLRLYRGRFTLWRSDETCTLSPNGHGVRVDAHASFGPWAFFPEHDEFPASVFDGGMRNLHRIKLLGGRFLGRYEVQPDRIQVNATVANEWLLAHQALTKVSASPCECRGTDRGAFTSSSTRPAPPRSSQFDPAVYRSSRTQLD